jgi:cell division protein FtsI/penicillin-binding protein 2
MLQKRVRLTFGILCLGYIAIAGRLAFLQVYQHKKFVGLAGEIHGRTVPMYAVRGSIFDRNGEPLAISVDVGDIIADPKVIAYPEQTTELLATTLGLTPDKELSLCNEIAMAKLHKTKSGKSIRFLVLAKNIPYSQIDALQQQMKDELGAYDTNPIDHPNYLAGVSINAHQTRSYPYGDIAAQVLGFPARGPNGQFVAYYGVEASQEAVLAGKDGSLTTGIDGAGRPIPGATSKITPAENGQNVTLTIDLHIQEIAQRVLYNMVKLHHAQSGSVVVLDPKTGDILAMANDPIFDPNSLSHTKLPQWDDRAVTDLYEPGSTLKTLTLAAVLDKEGLSAANDRVYCTGKLKVGNHIVHCAPDPPDYGVHGSEDMQDVLRNSCNIGASIYALKLGAENLFHYEKAFGLLDPPDCGLPGAEHSWLKDPAVERWPDIKLADVSFGQGISLTALQLASVYATIANNGVRVFPHIVLGAKPPQQPYPVVKPEVAQRMMTMLRAVVTDGTGTPAQIADYGVGGKTGSAQVSDHGHYGDAYIGSFCGIAPLSNPRLVVLCVINRPVGVHWGAIVAAPVVHDILQQSLWYLKVPPDAPGQPDYSATAESRPVATPPEHKVLHFKKRLHPLDDMEKFG